ncbi:protein serine/threonine phosphatase 2C [Gloeopeniophorella convolvens]|nr:protein serine/threonine phosphatase 2C [Gloeopeniophorella convolvens]
MLRRAWKPVVGVVVVATPAAYLYRRYTATKPPGTFNINVREKGPDGKTIMAKRDFALLSKDEVDRRIGEFATFTSQAPYQGLIWKHTTAHLSSNSPIEDAHAEAVITTDATTANPARNLLFYAVMDGHAGTQTSSLLSHVLIPAVALELASFIHGESASAKAPSVLDSVRSLVSSKPLTPVDAPKTNHIEQVSQAIQRAFSNVDFEIVNGPLRLLAANVGKLDKDKIPDLSQHPMAEASITPALSGSCALMAFLDPSNNDLYVACTGDSRAVAGIWEENEDGTGKWRVEVLSEDQTGRNPNELKRVQSEHPASEADEVIMRGRILGGLEPSRAFGDARYKWPREVQDTLNKAFIAGTGKNMRAPPATLKTPPYVTATPVVTHRKLSLPRPGADTPTASLRFLVLATDGLWDELSSEEVVSLVGGYLAGLKGTVPKADLDRLVPTTRGAPTVRGKTERTSSAPSDAWAFEDDNVSAHLIRNAFGGGNEAALRRILSIPAPHSRRWRDDVTVTVVWWEEAEKRQARARL